MSNYPPEIIKSILAQASVSKVLAVINYRRDTLQSSGGVIRCFCPIHREAVFRTLIIDEGHATYRCSYTLCKGAQGGDMIDLYARVSDLPYDEAAAKLVEVLRLDVELPVIAAPVTEAVKQAFELLNAEKLEEAESAFLAVLDRESDHLDAHKGLAQVYEKTNDTIRYVQTSLQTGELLIRAERFKEAQDICDRILEKDPTETRALEQTARCLLGLNDKAGGLEIYMRLADQLETQGQFDQAIEVYRTVERIDLDVIDVYPHIIHAMLATDQRQEAMNETEEKMNVYLQARDWDLALHSMGYMVSMDEERDDIRRRMIETIVEAGLTDQRLSKALDIIEELIERHALGLAAEMRELLTQHAPDNTRLMNLSSLIFKAQGEETAARESQLALADQLVRIGAEAQARSVLEEMRADHGAALPVLLRLGRMYRNSGEVTHALNSMGDIIATLEQSGSLKPENSDLPDTLYLLQTICEMAPADVERQVEFIRVALQVEDSPRAAAHLEKVLRMMIDEGDYALALEMVDLHGILLPDQGAALAMKAQCLEGLERPEEAKDALLAACDAYTRTDNRDLAIEVIQKHIQRYPNDTAVLELMSDLRSHESDTIPKGAVTPSIPVAQADEAEEAGAESWRDSALSDTMPVTIQGEAGEFESLQLVREYNFDTFVVDDLNNFAYATSLAVAKAPAQDYNPLFLHGDVGVGKTHLINAIANYVLDNHPQISVVYLSADDFATWLIEAISNNNVRPFRERFRQAGILLIDDIHFLAGKERAQEEFFNIFNNLFQARRQIVITSDRSPRELQLLEKRLRSRFGAGVVVDILAPNQETREAILMRERTNQGRDSLISDEVIREIARHVKSNVRELKGAFNQTMAMADLLGKPVTPELVRQIVQRLQGGGGN